MKRVLIGDIHAMRNAPHFKATTSFFKFLLKSDLNNSETTLVFLGDVVHSALVEPSVVALWLWFASKYKGKIEIMSGNHDDSAIKKENFLDIFDDCKNVTTFKEKTEIEHGNLKVLYLPFYRVDVDSNNISMEESYLCVEGEYDYIHLHAEIYPHFPRGIKLSKDLKGKLRCGHIHTGSEDGIYLPSVNPTSTTEKDVVSYLEIVDCETKEVEIREIPRFLNYARVNYPEALPEMDESHGKIWLLDVYEGLNRTDVHEFYAEALAKENTFLHKVYKKTYIQDKDSEIYRSSKVQTKTRMEFFTELSILKKFDDNLISYLTPYIK